jgi:hypothetical protein
VSPSSTSDSQSNVTFSPAQAKFMYWFTGLAPIPKALTPLATFWGDVRKSQYRKLPPGVRAARLYQNVVSDVGRQTATCTFQLVSYFVAGDLIKLALKQISFKQGKSAPKDKKAKDEARQQIIIQVLSLVIQVTATILSRPFGASQLIGLFHQEAKPMAATGGKWQGRVNNWVNKNLRALGTKHLLPFKTAMLATGGISLYLGSLVAVLYGISTMLEKAFPRLYPSKKKQIEERSDSQQSQPQTSLYNSDVVAQNLWQVVPQSSPAPPRTMGVFPAQGVNARQTFPLFSGK